MTNIEKGLIRISAREMWEKYFLKDYLLDLYEIKNGKTTIEDVIKFYEVELDCVSQSH